MSLRELLFLNLGLQLFDGLLSYQAFSLGAGEANPFVGAAISSLGVTHGLLYKKILACFLLLLIFALRYRLPSLTKQGLIATASVYGCVVTACVWKILSWE